MKNLLLNAVVIILTIFTVQSQEFKLGAKVGVNFASIGGDDIGDTEARTAFHVGGLVEIPITEKFAIQPEILYSSLGAKEEYVESPADFPLTYESRLKLGYISIPIMAKYYIVAGLSIEAGPQFGILVSAKAEGEVSGMGESETFDRDLKDEFKTLDIGVGLGAAYRLNNGVFFSARYVLGISDISEDIVYNGGSELDSSKLHNNVFQLSTGYSF